MMKGLLFILALVISVAKCEAQNTSNDSLVVVTFCEQMPEFVGGQEMLHKFIAKNLIYPEDARKNGIEGRVVLQFIVEQDGSLSHIEVLKPLPFGCSEEAIRLFNSMPKWIPGRQNGNLVRVKFVYPLVFKLK